MSNTTFPNWSMSISVISRDALVFYIKAPGRGMEIAEIRPLRCVGFEE
jgi:hypothetical protein